jgi:hypothetical protein
VVVVVVGSNLFHIVVKYRLHLYYKRLYIYTSYWIEKSTTKAIAFVEKIDYMLQRQIVVKGLGKQIGIEDKVHKRCYHKFSFRILDSHICQRYHIQDCIITEVSN